MESHQKCSFCGTSEGFIMAIPNNLCTIQTPHKIIVCDQDECQKKTKDLKNCPFCPSNDICENKSTSENKLQNENKKLNLFEEEAETIDSVDQLCALCGKEKQSVIYRNPECIFENHHVCFCENCYFNNMLLPCVYCEVPEFYKICQICMQSKEDSQLGHITPNCEKHKFQIYICMDCNKYACPICKSEGERPQICDKKQLCEKCKKNVSSLEFVSPKCYTRSHNMYLCSSCVDITAECPFCLEQDKSIKDRPKSAHMLTFFLNKALLWIPEFNFWEVTKILEEESEIKNDFLFPEMAAAVPLENFIYKGLFIGGHEIDCQVVLDQVYYIDIFQFIILKKQGNLSTPRYLHAAVSWSEKLHEKSINEVLVVGGKTIFNPYQVAYLHTCEKWSTDAEGWKPFPHLNKARAQAAIVLFEEVVYIFGGFQANSHLATGIESISKEGTEWNLIEEPANNLLMNLAAHQALPWNDKILVLGGSSGRQLLSSMMYYNPKTNEITDFIPFRKPRACFKAISEKNKAYICFGLNSQGFCENYDDETSEWKESFSYLNVLEGEEERDVIDSDFTFNTSLCFVD